MSGPDSKPDLGPAPSSDADDREAKLALVRKLILASKKDDENAMLDALEDLIAECSGGGDYSSLGGG